jgi:hypothetical protein
VEQKLEELKARRLALLDKDEESLSRREIAELKDYEKLEADKAKWFELLQKAQGMCILG